MTTSSSYFPSLCFLKYLGLFFYRSSGDLIILFPQLLETVPQNIKNPSVDLLPPKSGECQLCERLGLGLEKEGVCFSGMNF